VKTRPNLLVILSDQHGRPFSSCYGHPHVRTPNLDRLAARGLRFDNAYCNSPLCVPSRSALMTGKRVSTLGVWDNNTILGSGEPTLGHHLRGAGYDAVLCGRMHFNGDDKLHGFARQIASDPDANASIPEWEAGGRVEGHQLRSLPADAGSGMALDDTAEEKAISHVRSKEDSDTPWALIVGFKHPHRPWNAEQRFWDLYDEAALDLPGEPGPGDHHPVHDRNRLLRRMLEEGFPEKVIRHARAGYYASISRMDEKVGSILDALDASGQAERTLVVYTSDHGTMLGDHGLWMKSSLFENSAGVPLILAGPGIPNGTRNENVSLMDLTATLTEISGGDPSEMDGRSLTGVIDGTGRWDNYALCEYYATWTDRPMAALRRDHHKIMASVDEAPQVFDLEADPGETRDLSALESCREIRAALSAELAALWNGDGLRRTVLDSQRARLAAQRGSSA